MTNDEMIQSIKADLAANRYNREEALRYALRLGRSPDADCLVRTAKTIEAYLSGMVTLDPTVLPE